jgi:hypothetical protein
VKALIFPITIHTRRYLGLPSAQSPKGCDVLIINLKTRKRSGVDFAIVLRIGAGAGNGSYVDNLLDPLRPEQIDEDVDRSS